MNDKRKPFDLARALAGAPVQTRDGREVTQLTELEGSQNTWVAGMLGNNSPKIWHGDGQFLVGSEDDRDLVMAPSTMQLWARPINDPEIGGVSPVFQQVLKGIGPKNLSNGLYWAGPAVLIHEWEE